MFYAQVRQPSLETVTLRCVATGHPLIMGHPADKTHQTRHIYSMLDQCWPTVYDDGPTLVKHWVDVSCLLGGHWSLIGLMLSTVDQHWNDTGPYKVNTRSILRVYLVATGQRHHPNKNPEINSILKVIYHNLYGMHNYVLIWGNWLRGSHERVTW